MTRPPLRLVESARAAQGDPGPDDDRVPAGPQTSGWPVDTDTDADADAARGTTPAAPGSGAPSVSPRVLVLGAVALQFAGSLRYLHDYLELSRSGAVSPAAALLAAPAALCLYAGALLLALRPGRGRTLFWIATVGLGLAVPFWGISYAWSWPVALGAMAGLAGAWYARAETPAEAGDSVQP